MAGKQGGDHLVAVVRELHRELADPAGAGPDPQAAPEALRGSRQAAGGGEDGLVAELREELGKLAEASLIGAGPEQRRAVRAALDGAELVIRGEIAAERLERLASHLPGIAFVIVLPGLGRERALAVSRRASELLERD